MVQKPKEVKEPKEVTPLPVGDAFKDWAKGLSQAVEGADHHLAVDKDKKDDSADIEDCVFEKALQEFYDKRRDVALEHSVDVAHLCTILRGGAWTAAKKKKAYDVIRGQCRGNDVSDWCKLHGFNKSSSYDVTTYTETNAARMASEWCRRMEWLYSGGAMPSNDPDAVYPEHKDFTDWVSALPRNSPCHERIAHLHQLVTDGGVLSGHRDDASASDDDM